MGWNGKKNRFLCFKLEFWLEEGKFIVFIFNRMDHEIKMVFIIHHSHIIISNKANHQFHHSQQCPHIHHRCMRTIQALILIIICQGKWRLFLPKPKFLHFFMIRMVFSFFITLISTIILSNNLNFSLFIVQMVTVNMAVNRCNNPHTWAVTITEISHITPTCNVHQSMEVSNRQNC